MKQFARITGPAGTGKTTELLRLMDLALKKDIHDPRLIGFVSFTRAARREAATRAADQFGMKPAELETGGWFRTLHSVCYRVLGVGKELLAGNKADRQWLTESLQEDVEGKSSGLDQDFADPFAGNDTGAGRALALWDVARNRLESYKAAWERADAVDERTPMLAECEKIVMRYEQAKRLDHRADFTDLLTRFAGWYCSLNGAEKCEPEGEAPDLPVWCFDEQQDASALLHSVCERLVQQPSVRYVYVAGDDAQSIFGWAGSAPHWFREGWPVAKSRTLSQSYRCPTEIVNLGEGLLRECFDSKYYDDRAVKGVEGGGIIDRESLSEMAGLVDPRESWLLLARTNFFASRMAKALDDEGVPWVPTRGNSPWNAPVRGQAIAALRNLQAGAPIDGIEFQSILKFVKSKSGHGVLLEHGTKARFEDMTAEQAQTQYSWVHLDELQELGATPLFIEGVRQGSWRQWIDFAERTTQAIDRWGQEAVDKPGIKIGTIHSAKGAEADNVALLTSIPSQCYKAAQSPEGFDEEQRVFYVAVTRARKRLVLLDEPKARYRKKIEY